MRSHDFESPNNPLEWSERFDEEFTYANFTWNGDNFNGVEFAEKTRQRVKAFIHQVRQEAYVKGQTDGYEYGYRVAAEGVIESIAPDDGVDYGLVRRDLKSQLKQRWLGGNDV
jgi:hypothetical protein